MSKVRMKYAWVLSGYVVSVVLIGSSSVFAQGQKKVDVDGKIVLANVDRYPAHFRVGKTRKEIKPRKASVLTPKRFPVNVEVWNGVRGNAKWEKQSLASAGIYTLRFQNGRWSLRKAPPRGTTGATQRRYATRPRSSYRRSTGSAPRVVRRSRRPYYGPRVAVLARTAGSALWLYRFVRDEEDRDLLRSWIIGEEIDREIEREIFDRLDDMAVNLPAGERLEFERALRDLDNLSDRDIESIENATDDDWNQVRDYLGDQVTDNAWNEFASDFGDIDVNDLADQDIDIGDANIDTLDADVDIGDIDAGDIDVGDLGGTLDNVDIGDLGGGIEDIDIGDIGGDFGADFGGGDFGGGDLGGGFGGGFDGGGFDYDAGGFDDFGGGFDDFGGGFDDFGGGFDDFGGGDFF